MAPDPAVQVGWRQGAVLALYAVAVAGVMPQMVQAPQAMPASEKAVAAPPSNPSAAAEAERCKVPEFAKAIGHEAMWKLHNGC